MESYFKRAGIRVGDIQTMPEERAQAEATFAIIVALLLVMTALLGLVGGLGLMGTMSINILERTREIGVLRAIGAADRSVAQVFVVEGVCIGLLSWVLGSLVAIPLSRFISDSIGALFMGVPLTYTYSLGGMWLWLAVVVALSALASFLPARSASRLTVREILAYE